MKFPNDLSKERLSLLSKEDRAIYESERKQRNEEKIQRVFADNSVMEALSEDIFEDVDEEDETEYFINDEMDVLYEKMLAEIMPIEEFNEAKSEVLSLLDSIQEEKELINMEEIISLVFDEILSLIFLIVAAWYGLYRLLRALWEHDNSSESCKKRVDSNIEPWYNKYDK